MAPQNSGLAVASLALGIAGFFMGIPAGIAAILLGIAARKEIDRSNGKLGGKEYANGGIITGAISILIFILVMVMVFVFLIAAMAIPGYLQFRASKLQAEAKENLFHIYDYEQMYFAKNQQYATNFADLDWSPAGPTKYSYFLGPDQERPATTGQAYLVPDNLEAYVTTDQFQALAVGNLDADSTLDVWAINQNRELTHLSNDTFEESK